MSLWINLSVALLLGVLGYMLPALLAATLPARMQMKIGEHYYKNAMRSYGKLAFVRRILGSYELHPIKVDDESKTAKVTFDSGILSPDTDMPFKDPDDRIKRMYKKPVAVAIEQVPSALDPEIAEEGYWTREKHVEDGLTKTGIQKQVDEQGNVIGEEEVTMVDPYVPVSPRRRVVDAIDSLSIVAKDTRPENIDTAKELTHRRYDEYGSGLDVAQTARMVTGFLAGAGGYLGVRYMQTSVMDGAGTGGGTGIGIPSLMPFDYVPLAMEVITYVP